MVLLIGLSSDTDPHKRVYADHMGNYLGRVRLSVHTDESTSVERQREKNIEQWATMHGHRIVGWAEDIDVSGKVSPFDTPQFGGLAQQSLAGV